MPPKNHPHPKKSPPQEIMSVSGRRSLCGMGKCAPPLANAIFIYVIYKAEKISLHSPVKNVICAMQFSPHVQRWVLSPVLQTRTRKEKILWLSTALANCSMLNSSSSVCELDMKYQDIFLTNRRKQDKMTLLLENIYQKRKLMEEKWIWIVKNKCFKPRWTLWVPLTFAVFCMKQIVLHF